ncbi:unnamed protein product [Mesocestoides corti]|uniref:RabBD domain-containing protein n=1 Tax=Mesocestoides corti TaxID=53468 RepID=A0A0R3UQ93_MESCO|nr:unnamed protein product [Mesocestoides corti]
MGNETSYQDHRFPVLAFKRLPTGPTPTDASSLPSTPRREGFIRRQESYPSEPDYTDSSDNSVVYRRRAAGGGNSTHWLQTVHGSGGTPSSEKGSLLDLLVRRISRQNLASSSDDDQAGGTKDMSSATSLQDSVCEILESSQQLSEAEKEQIKHVLNRVRQVEHREAERVS